MGLKGGSGVQVTRSHGEGYQVGGSSILQRYKTRRQNCLIGKINLNENALISNFLPSNSISRLVREAVKGSACLGGGGQ